MAICKGVRPVLVKQPNGVEVACHLFDSDQSDPELYRKLSDEEKLEDEY